MTLTRTRQPRRAAERPGLWQVFSSFPRLLPFLRPHWRLAAAAVSMIGASVVIGLAAPWPLAIVIDTVLGKRPLPSIFEPTLGGFGTYGLLAILVVSGLVLTFLAYGLGIIDNYVTTKLNLVLVLDFRLALYEHAQRLSFGFYDRIPTGQIIFRLGPQSTAIGQIIVGLPPLVQSLITMVGMFVIAVFIDWQLALLSLVVLPIIVYTTRFYALRVQPRVYEVRSLEAESQTILFEGVSMMRVITAFGREKHEYRRWREQAERANVARIRLTVWQTVYSLVIGVTTAAGTALLIGFGAVNVLEGRLSLGELVVLLGYIASIYGPLTQVSSTFTSLQRQFINLESSLSILDTPLDVSDAPDAVAIDKAEGRITFDRVGFTYGEVEYNLDMKAPRARVTEVLPAGLELLNTTRRVREFLAQPGMFALYEEAKELGLDVEPLLYVKRDPALTDVSFEIEPGQHVAIVGPTGAGKTTVVNLLMRFYDPAEGRILLDGIDLRKIALESLRQQVSIVPQEPLLFAGSIAHNIRYGKLGATDEEIEAAARAANIHDFITGLPDDYETIIGERGSQLSGGERQRISVARAFLKDAPIAVMDEPTSSIDSETESVILAALERLMEGRTTFTIAHRLATIRRADVILVLDHGRLVQQGSHEELLDEGGVYRRLHELQIGGERTRGGRRRMGEVRKPRAVGLLLADLLLVALAHLVRDGSTRQLRTVIENLPQRWRIGGMWPLFGAVLAVLADDEYAPLQALADANGGPSPLEQVRGQAAEHLLESGEVLRRLSQELGRSPGAAARERLDPDLVLSEPWTQVRRISPEAADLIAESLPTDLSTGPRRQRPPSHLLEA